MRGRVVLWVGSESADVDLAGRDGTIGVNLRRKGSGRGRMERWDRAFITHDDGDEGILELLVVHLGVDVDTRKPASVAGMGVVPADGIFQPPCLEIMEMRSAHFFMKMATHLLASLDILDHVLVCLCSSVDTGFSSLNGQSERVHDDDRVPNDLSLHKTHNFVWYTRSCMNDL